MFERMRWSVLNTSTPPLASARAIDADSGVVVAGAPPPRRDRAARRRAAARRAAAEAVGRQSLQES